MSTKFLIFLFFFFILFNGFSCVVKLLHLISSKMQKLVKAAKEGTKDGLEKTKAAVKKGRSFIRTKSFCQGVLKYTICLPVFFSL